MRTTIYWAIQHSRVAVRAGRWHARCWWLNQQVEFLGWRLWVDERRPQSLVSVVPQAEQGGDYAMPSL
jgi:hypothetical protein